MDTLNYITEQCLDIQKNNIENINV